MKSLNFGSILKKLHKKTNFLNFIFHPKNWFLYIKSILLTLQKFRYFPTNDMQTHPPSPPSELPPFSWKMRTLLNRMKNHISDFSVFDFWVMADCIYNLRVKLGFSILSPTKKMTFKSGQIYSKYLQWAETNENQFSDFGDFYFLSWSKNWPILSTKTTISQKPKIVKCGKLIFHSLQLIAHIFCKFDYFWTTFFWSLTYLKIKVSPVNCKYNQP